MFSLRCIDAISAPVSGTRAGAGCADSSASTIGTASRCAYSCSVSSAPSAIGHQLAYIGTLTRAAVEPRGILTAALLSNAAGILLFHNHPSGDPSPSAEDLAFTRRMAEAGEVVGVRVVDHIIIGEAPAFVSLRQRGAF